MQYLESSVHTLVVTMAVFNIFPKLETRFTIYPAIKTRKKEKKGVSIKPPNQNSFAFIICKNHPESRLETLILRQKSW